MDEVVTYDAASPVFGPAYDASLMAAYNENGPPASASSTGGPPAAGTSWYNSLSLKDLLSGAERGLNTYLKYRDKPPVKFANDGETQKTSSNAAATSSDFGAILKNPLVLVLGVVLLIVLVKKA